MGAHVSRAQHDRRELAVAVKEMPSGLGSVQTILADKGYDNSQQIAEVEARTGAVVLCPPQEPPERAQASRYAPRPLRAERLRRRARMRTRLATPEGRALYRKRNISEAQFAMIKRAMGFTEFHLRGHAKVSLEWMLVCLAANCRKLSGPN